MQARIQVHLRMPSIRKVRKQATTKHKTRNADTNIQTQFMARRKIRALTRRIKNTLRIMVLCLGDAEKKIHCGIISVDIKAK